MLFGFTRVVLGWHTIFDVLIGGAVGAAGVLAMARLAGRRPPEVRPFVVLVVGAVVVLALHGHKLWAEATLYSIALRIRPG